MIAIKAALVFHGLFFIGMLTKEHPTYWFITGWFAASGLVTLGVILPTVPGSYRSPENS